MYLNVQNEYRIFFFSYQNPKSEAITMALVKMIATDMLPLSFGEGTGFHQFMQTICPEYTIPSQKVIINRLRELYDLVRKEILSTFNQYSSVSITTDAWTSRTATSYITITVHAIDNLWNLHSMTLDTLDTVEAHTSSNLYQHLYNALYEWEIAAKSVAVVHDNAPNIVAAIRDGSLNYDRIGESMRCFCHSLQLVITRALTEESVNKYVQKVSAIVGHFKHSNKAFAALTDAQKKCNLPSHRLVNHCLTRWNSAYEMIERALEQRQAIECVLLDSDVTTVAASKKLLLHNRDWIYLDAVQKMLKPFFVATSVMSNESQSTISMVRPIVHSIANNFLKSDDDDTPSIQILKKILLDELENRFLHEDPITMCGLACFLDPR